MCVIVSWRTRDSTAFSSCSNAGALNWRSRSTPRQRQVTGTQEMTSIDGTVANKTHKLSLPRRKGCEELQWGRCDSESLDMRSLCVNLTSGCHVSSLTVVEWYLNMCILASCRVQVIAITTQIIVVFRESSSYGPPSGQLSPGIMTAGQLD